MVKKDKTMVSNANGGVMMRGSKGGGGASVCSGGKEITALALSLSLF